MPKMKTNSSAKKRFRVTPNGKVLYAKAGLRHNLENMSPKRKRHASKDQVLSGASAEGVLRLLGRR